MSRGIKIASIKAMFFLFGLFLLLSYWSILGVMSINNVTHNIQTDSLPLKTNLCYVNFKDNRPFQLDNQLGDLKTIYYVTPTYPRPEQIPELTRLSYTLMHVSSLHWIVADDQMVCSEEVLDVLQRSGLPFTYLTSPKPNPFKGTILPRGVSNRKAALSWLRNHAHNGVMYFGDDDNTVDIRLFNEIRKTKKVSMFPVGLIGSYGVSAPVVRDGKVVAFFDSWPASRTFPVDMAGFAVNLQHLTPNANMPFVAGYEEDEFLISLGLKLDDIEPLADNCSKILVWHTRTVKAKKTTLRFDVEKLSSSKKFHSFAKLLNETARLGMAQLDPHGGLKTSISRKKKTYQSVDSLP